jgi:conjugal transfer pilin signal peptidase TrbI
MRLTPTLGRSAFGALFRDMRRLWYVVLPILGIWVLAYMRLFVDPTPRIPVLFNWTPSLPCRVAWLVYTHGRLQRGDYVVFAFDGEAQMHYPGLRGQPFFKVVRGMPGDTISVIDRVVFINDEVVGVAKTHTHDRRPLEPIVPAVIPAGHYYVQGTSPDSFDSRYQASGLVRADQLIGTVIPLW